MQAIVLRADAKSKGLPRYFTGKPCVLGGIAEKRVGDGKCLCDAHKEKIRLYAESHKDQYAQSMKKYQSANRKLLAEKARAAYAKNPDADNARSKKYKDANKEVLAEKRKIYEEVNKGKISKRSKEWHVKNREKNNKISLKYYFDNHDLRQQKGREYKANNKDKVKKSSQKWRQENKDKCDQLFAKRRASKLGATPSWYGELDELVDREAHDLRVLRNEATGIEWHVDHMIPLQAKEACGLHWSGNLQVIPAKMNLSKLNRMILTEPGEWILALL